MGERGVIAVQCSMCRAETAPGEWKEHQRACRPKGCYCEDLDPDTECSECFEWIPLPVKIVGRFRTYNPATHRLVPRDAVHPSDGVVLEREDVRRALLSVERERLWLQQALAAWVESNEAEELVSVQGVASRLRSALASAQGNEEGSDG